MAKKYFRVSFRYEGSTSVILRATSMAEAERAAWAELPRRGIDAEKHKVNLVGVEPRPDMDEDRRQKLKYL